MTGPGVAPPPITGGPAERTAKAGLRAVRLVLWLAEEWFRQIVAEYHRRRGRIVLFDRHFYADYYHFDVATEARRPLSSRLHGWLLKNVYPKPDLVICLDAPGQVLFDRKGEASPEWLENRRRQYLQLSAVIPDFVVVDVNRPLDVVTHEVATVISEYYLKRNKRP